MRWRPISEEELWESINRECERMSFGQARLWDFIKITPEKWMQTPWGDEGNGFWVVAVFGNQVLWYNDIEEGYNISNFQNFGVIDEYLGNQDTLQEVIAGLEYELSGGTAAAGRTSAPLPGPAPEHPKKL